MAKKQTEQETLAERLRRMAQTDIRTVDKNTLVERSTVVTIHGSGMRTVFAPLRSALNGCPLDIRRLRIP